MNLPLYQVDAFAENLFEGNPAAVCPLEEWLPDKVLQQIAAENNLAETAFFVPTSEGFHLRWFTPTIEVDLCGHATLATAHILFHLLGYREEVIVFQSKSGPLPVFKTKHGLTMDFPMDTLKTVEATLDIERALGTEVKEMYRGINDYMAVIGSEEALRHLEPDLRALSLLKARGLIVTAKGEEVDFVSRCFYPQSGVDEDPATGSAHTTLCPYWAKKLNKKVLYAQQLSKRVGHIHCELKSDRVLLSGQAIVYLRGEICLYPSLRKKTIDSIRKNQTFDG